MKQFGISKSIMEHKHKIFEVAGTSNKYVYFNFVS